MCTTATLTHAQLMLPPITAAAQQHSRSACDSHV